MFSIDFFFNVSKIIRKLIIETPKTKKYSLGGTLKRSKEKHIWVKIP